MTDSADNKFFVKNNHDKNKGFVNNGSQQETGKRIQSQTDP